MKWITAIVQPHRLDAVREALTANDIVGMTVTEVKGFGRQRGHTEIYRGAEYLIAYTPKLKIEIAVNDEQCDACVEAVRAAAHTGRIGDGKIFVFDLQSALRVRTGEIGPEAI